MVGIAVAATIAFGAVLGFRRQWGYLAWSCLLGCLGRAGHLFRICWLPARECSRWSRTRA